MTLPGDRRRRARLGVLAVVVGGALVVVPATSAVADEVRLANGDLLRGTIGTATESELTFTHALGQTWKLPWAQVRAIRSDGPLTLRLKDGQILKGIVRYGPSDDTLTLAPAGLGEVAGLPFGELSAIGDPPPPARWKGTLSAGLTSYDGNTRGRSGNLRVNAQRKSRVDLIEARATYNYAEDGDGRLSARNGQARIQYNYTLYKGAYVYAGGTFEYDRFKFLNLRSRGGLGLGLALLDLDWLEWRCETGVEYVNEDLRDAPDERFTGARGATTFQWDLIPGVRFAEQIEAVFSFEDDEDFTLRFESTLSLDVGYGFGVGISVITEYDESPPPSARHRADTKYQATVTWTF